MQDPSPITTVRLDLIPLRPTAVRALLYGDLKRASRAQGLALSVEVPVGGDSYFLQVQLERMEANPEQRAWCVRAMVRCLEGAVIGHCGFHGPPGSVGRAEIGYTVFPAHRGQGYATEAARALVDWAHGQDQNSVFATVAPNNLPSLALGAPAGLRRDRSRGRRDRRRGAGL